MKSHANCVAFFSHADHLFSFPMRLPLHSFQKKKMLLPLLFFSIPAHTFARSCLHGEDSRRYSLTIFSSRRSLSLAFSLILSSLQGRALSHCFPLQGDCCGDFSKVSFFLLLSLLLFSFLFLRFSE